MRIICCCLSIFGLGITSLTSAQTNYFTVASGNWNDPSIWSPTPIEGHPNSTDGTITISAAHTIIIPASLLLTIDETIVEGSLTLVSASQCTIVDGTGTDLVVSGTVNRGDLSVINQQNGSTVSFHSGAVYNHQYKTTAGNLMDALWDVNSMINITGYTSSAVAFNSSTWSSALGNVTYNCASQSGTVDLAGLVNNVKGNFKITNTGSGLLRFSSSQSPAITIDGNFEVENNARVCLSTSGRLPGTTFNIGGDFLFHSINPLGSFVTQTGICNVNVLGNLSIDASTGLLQTSTGLGEATINLSGNFELKEGRLNGSRSSNGKQGSLYFEGSINTMHTFFNAGTITGDMHYSVSTGNVLRVLGESAVMGDQGSEFTLAGKLIVESIDINGAIQIGYGSGPGNIRTAGRTYDAGSIIVYNNTNSAQVMGDGQPGTTGAGTTSIASITQINNPAGITVNSISTATVTIGGILEILNGDFIVANDNLTIKGDVNILGGNIILDTSSPPPAAAKTLRCDGNIDLTGKIKVISGSVNGDNATLDIRGDILGNNYFTFSGPNCRVTIQGTAPLTFARDFPIDAPTTLEQLTINRAGATVVVSQNLTLGGFTAPSTYSGGLILTRGNLKINASLTVTAVTTLTSGTLYFEDQVVELKRQITSVSQIDPVPSGVFSPNENSTLKITGTYSNLSNQNTLLFSTGAQLGTLLLDRTTDQVLPHISINSAVTITAFLYLINGELNNASTLNMVSGSTIIRTPSASVYTGCNKFTGGGYDIIYEDGIAPVTKNIHVGLEASGLIQNFTCNLTDTLTALSSLEIQGTFTINSGVCNLSGNVSCDNVVNKGILNAPIQISIDHNFVNDAVFNHNEGTILFSNNSTLSGNSNIVFYDISITGILNCPAQLDVAGDFINNGIFNANTGVVRFVGSSLQHIEGDSTTNFNNITISTNSIVSIETSQNILGLLTLQNQAILDADGSSDNATFTLVSQHDSPPVNASIAVLPEGAIINGKVTVQRYMSGEGRIYRYLSSPVTNATVADWMDDFPITGDFEDPSTSPPWPKVICGSSLRVKNPSLYFYDETKPGASESGYVSYPNKETFSYESNLEAGKGYASFIRQCSAATILDVTGPINQGAITLPVTYTNTSNDSLQSIGWNLVGNPYPSAIDWRREGDLNNNGNDADAVDGWIKNNIAAAIAIRDNGTGQFRYWDGDNGEGTNEIRNGIIALGQAFWIRTTDKSPSLIIREGVKSNNAAEFYSVNITPTLVISLKKDLVEDKAYVKIRIGAKEVLDYWDAPKLDNESFNLSTISPDGIAMAINAVPEVLCNTIVKVKMTDVTPGVYTIKLSSRGEFDLFQAELYDKFLNQSKTLVWDEDYVFVVNDDIHSKDVDRFIIKLYRTDPEKVIADVPSSICKADGIVTLLNTQKDVSYSIWAENKKMTIDYYGNGSSLPIVLRKDSLLQGPNSFFIRARSSCGMSVSSAINMLFENPKVPAAYGHAVCFSGFVKLFVLNNDSSDSFKWFENKDDIEPMAWGETFITPVIETTKTYFVSMITPGGCESERLAVEAKVINLKPPMIESKGDTLQVIGFENVQWYFNQLPIEGENSSSLVVKAPGQYSVSVAIAGCKAQSQDFEYSVTDIESVDTKVKIYPNPVVDKLFLNINLIDLDDVFLTNSVGLKFRISVSKTDDSLYVFDIGSLPTGIYILEVKSDKFYSVYKIVKTDH